MGTTTSIPSDGTNVFESLVKKEKEWKAIPRSGITDWDGGSELELHSLTFATDGRVTLEGGRGFPVHDYFRFTWEGTWEAKGSEALTLELTHEKMNHEHTMEMCSMPEEKKVNLVATVGQPTLKDKTAHLVLEFKDQKWPFYSLAEEQRLASEARRAAQEASDRKEKEINEAFAAKAAENSLSQLLITPYSWYHAEEHKEPGICTLRQHSNAQLRFFKDFTFELTLGSFSSYQTTCNTLKGTWEESSKSTAKLHIESDDTSTTVEAKVSKARLSTGPHAGSALVVTLRSSSEIEFTLDDRHFLLTSTR